MDREKANAYFYEKGWKDCKKAISSHAVLGEVRAIINRLVIDGMDDYYKTLPEGKQLVKDAYALLDKLSEHLA